MSVNTSPSFVRRVVAKLSKAGLVQTATGKTGSCWLSKKPEQVSLLQIYRAVGPPKACGLNTCNVPSELIQMSSNVTLLLSVNCSSPFGAISIAPIVVTVSSGVRAKARSR